MKSNKLQVPNRQISKRNYRTGRARALDAKANRNSALESAYKGNEHLLSMFAELRKKTGDAILNFASMGDGYVAADMVAEIERRIQMEVDSGTLHGLGLFFHRASSSAIAPALVIDVAAIRKEGNRLKKAYPNSILKSVVYPTLTGHDLAFGAATVALVLGTDAAEAPRMMSGGGATSAQVPSSVWKTNPTAVDIAEIMLAFQTAEQHIRRLNSAAAREREADRWSAVRAQARVQCGLIDILSPAKKTFDASGLGVGILKHALTGPDVRAKRAGKDGVSREELIYQIWNHALQTGGPAPAFVKL